MSFPVVTVESIPTQGLQAVVGEWARAAVAEGLSGTPSRLSGELSVRRVGRHIAVVGALRGAADTVCDRCGEPLEIAIEGGVSCLYSPVDAIPEVSEDEERSGPAIPDGIAVEVEDVGEYDGVSLDLRDVVREFFAVERPARFVCADVVPDADAACSARWRERSGAPDPAAASPFAALKVLKPPR